MAVAVGRGIQNYTCSAPTALPSAIGAVATLFDATSLAYSDEALLNTIPAIAVYMPLPSSNLSLSFANLDVLGHHFFDASGTPTFDLSSISKILYAAKTGDIKAPATANKGPAGTGAVDWLKLDAKATYTSVGLKEVYRVETAGGSAPSNCTGVAAGAVVSVQYAAEYWFYN